MKPSRFSTGTCRRNAGFTLIESIMVIVITGILVAAVAVFITKPVQGYVDSVKRAELTDAADMIVRRIAREVHLALPNSLRVGDSSNNAGFCADQAGVTCYIEFIPTSNGGRYRYANSTGFADGSTGGNPLYFNDPTKTATFTYFDVLGPMPSNPAIAVGDYVVVNNLGPLSTPANAYVAVDICTSCNRAKVSAVNPGSKLVTLAANPFADTSSITSSNNSFHVVQGTVKAVTLACPMRMPGKLTRYWNYGFNANLSPPPSDYSALLASNATCSGVSYFAGLLNFTLTLTDPTNNESVTLFRQILVDNSP